MQLTNNDYLSIYWEDVKKSTTVNVQLTKFTPQISIQFVQGLLTKHDKNFYNGMKSQAYLGFYC